MNADASPREMAADDAGLSLVELLVALFVGGMLLTLIASLFVSTMQATAATRDLDLATGRAQALSTSLQTDIRNAAEIIVEDIPGGGTLVRARVATGDTGWQCRAWALVDLTTTDADGTRDGADGDLEARTHTSAPLTGTQTAPAPATTWGALVDVVEPATDAAGAALPPFTLDDRHLSWNLTVVTSEQPQLNARSTTSLSGSAVAGARDDGSGARCW